MESVIPQLILIIAVVGIGIALLAFSFAYFLPKEVFSISQQQANQIAGSTSLSVGPLLINNTVGSVVAEVYNPSVNGSIEVVAFTIPASLQPSVGVVTPSTSSLNYQVYLTNNKRANTTTISGSIYDVGGSVIYSPSKLQVYTVSYNSPFTIIYNGVSSNQDLVVWIIYKVNNYWFRIVYTYTTVPQSP
ncbi:hypothetical protein [Sulfolobus acidocaldarius]|uniref:Uncharacterized protein n=1 Tax=Sulfolobus acidocaldarius N8 TaxID=1028566 RepID=M1I6C9_9CREN|nr:hypothetical protein [Sulfolobus acidocaldarius]AGE71593.1 hypothetical protein SacN8_08165 [Sulfolobus acidocaldarius N8]WCM35497.1 hypothetical protein GO597_09240 [Sulfolobus acidocaldarius DSM 639]